MRKYQPIDCIILLSALVTCTGIRDAAAATSPAYHVTDLGTLGGAFSSGSAINASGQVAGISFTTGDAYQRAFLYDGTLHDLGTLGGTYSSGAGINASGQLTGGSFPTGDAAIHAFLYDGTMHDLGTLGGTYSRGVGINASGQVTGNSSTTGVPFHAFLWTPTTPNSASGTMIDLGTLGGGSSSGLGINASGQVTGVSSTIGNAAEHAFLYDGTMHDLGTLGGAYSAGFGINDSGQVTGQSYTTEGAVHAFLYDGILHDLGTLGGGYSAGLGINASGQVTGQSSLTVDAASHAFLYTSGSGMVDLNSLIDPLSGWELFTANAINDAGQITGFGSIGGDSSHAFLLTPVPEPSTLALLALGLTLIVGRKSRRLAAVFVASDSLLRRARTHEWLA